MRGGRDCSERCGMVVRGGRDCAERWEGCGERWEGLC